MIWLLAFLLLMPGATHFRAQLEAGHACATPAPVASPIASANLCDWANLVEQVGFQLSEMSGEQFTFAERSEPEASTALPEGWVDGAVWRVELPNGGGFHWVALLHYADEAALDGHSDDHANGLSAAGYTAEDSAPDSERACFSLVREESARAVCTSALGTLMIVGYSFFEVDHPDGQIQTATALVEIVRAAVDEAFTLH